MKMILMTILGTLFNPSNGWLFEDNPDCITGCEQDYKQTNITTYANCLEHCCAVQSRSFTLLFVVLAMIVTSLGYFIYTRRQTEHSRDYYSMT